MDDPGSEVSTAVLVWVPACPPHENKRLTTGNPPARRVSPRRMAMPEMREIEIAVRERYFAFGNHGGDAGRQVGPSRLAGGIRIRFGPG